MPKELACLKSIAGCTVYYLNSEDRTGFGEGVGRRADQSVPKPTGLRRLVGPRAAMPPRKKSPQRPNPPRTPPAATAPPPAVSPVAMATPTPAQYAEPSASPSWEAAGPTKRLSWLGRPPRARQKLRRKFCFLPSRRSFNPPHAAWQRDGGQRGLTPRVARRDRQGR